MRGWMFRLVYLCGALRCDCQASRSCKCNGEGNVVRVEKATAVGQEEKEGYCLRCYMTGRMFICLS